MAERMTERTIVADDQSAYRDARCEATVKRVSPQLLTTVIRGEPTKGAVLWYLRGFHAFVDAAPLKVDIFHDWQAITTVDAEARRTFTDWAEERRELNRRGCRGVHTLVGSALMFGVLEAFARAPYRHTYLDRVKFEVELARSGERPSAERIERSGGPAH